VLVDDRARCIAAADGIVVLDPARLGPLLGLTSVLLFLDLSPDFGRGPDALCCLSGGLAGELSLEDIGEFAVDGEPEMVRERGPLGAWDLICAEGSFSEVDVGGCALFVEVVSAEAAFWTWPLLGAGSADSNCPVIERKPFSLVVMMLSGSAWGFGSAAC
jgi:hypothetical protein